MALKKIYKIPVTSLYNNKKYLRDFYVYLWHFTRHETASDRFVYKLCLCKVQPLTLPYKPVHICMINTQKKSFILHKHYVHLSIKVLTTLKLKYQIFHRRIWKLRERIQTSHFLKPQNTPQSSINVHICVRKLRTCHWFLFSICRLESYITQKFPECSVYKIHIMLSYYLLKAFASHVFGHLAHLVIVPQCFGLWYDETQVQFPFTDD